MEYRAFCLVLDDIFCTTASGISLFFLGILILDLKVQFQLRCNKEFCTTTDVKTNHRLVFFSTGQSVSGYNGGTSERIDIYLIGYVECVVNVGIEIPETT